MSAGSSPAAPGAEPDPRPGPARRRGLQRRVVRYGAGSVVATVCSEVAFLLLYGAAGTSPTVASVLAWLAGALPNYWLNRSWTWGRRGRPQLRSELLPYLVIILTTLGLAVGATSLADAVLTDLDASRTVRSLLVGGTFLLVYAVVFLLRFVLLERLFGGPSGGTDPGSRSTPRPSAPPSAPSPPPPPSQRRTP